MTGRLPKMSVIKANMILHAKFWIGTWRIEYKIIILSELPLKCITGLNFLKLVKSTFDKTPVLLKKKTTRQISPPSNDFSYRWNHLQPNKRQFLTPKESRNFSNLVHQDWRPNGRGNSTALLGRMPRSSCGVREFGRVLHIKHWIEIWDKPSKIPTETYAITDRRSDRDDNAHERLQYHSAPWFSWCSRNKKMDVENITTTTDTTIRWPKRVYSQSRELMTFLIILLKLHG